MDMDLSDLINIASNVSHISRGVRFGLLVKKGLDKMFDDMEKREAEKELAKYRGVRVTCYKCKKRSDLLSLEINNSTFVCPRCGKASTLSEWWDANPDFKLR